MPNVLSGSTDDASQLGDDVPFPVRVGGSRDGGLVSAFIVSIWLGYQALLPFELNVFKLVAELAHVEPSSEICRISQKSVVHVFH